MIIQTYNLPEDNCTIELPQGATMLAVHKQGYRFILTAMVDLEQPLESRRVFSVATGERVPGEYIGSIQPQDKHFFDGGVADV